MNKARSKPRRMSFDVAEHLTDDQAIAAYMNTVLEADDTDLLLRALGDVARARRSTDRAAS